MRVFVNHHPVDLPAGMTVRHALISAGLLQEVEGSAEPRKESAKKSYDEWGNEIGLDGALSEGMKIYVR